VSNSSVFTPALLRTQVFVSFAVHETRRIFLSPFISYIALWEMKWSNELNTFYSPIDHHKIRGVKVWMPVFRGPRVQLAWSCHVKLEPATFWSQVENLLILTPCVCHSLQFRVLWRATSRMQGKDYLVLCFLCENVLDRNYCRRVVLITTSSSCCTEELQLDVLGEASCSMRVDMATTAADAQETITGPSTHSVASK